MGFVRVWLAGYYHPVKMIEQLRSKPAPHWGFWAQLLRAALDSFLLYLPLGLLGRTPPEPSYLSLLPTDQYYWHLIWLAPMVLVVEWLLLAAVPHLVLRLAGRPSDFDQILNIGGMAALLVGTLLLIWDWLWFAVGGVDQYFLGISHLVIALWGTLVSTIGLNRILGVPLWLAVILNLNPITVPLKMMFMRSPQ
jgi:hypothetical protein